MYTANITQLLATYIHALHILHNHGVLDGYGHLSVRNPINPPTFFMLHTVAPALVASLDDIAEYRVSDATPVDPNAPQGPIERFIHSEMLKRYPDINVVLHGHPDTLISYSINHVPLRPAIHMAGFLGEQVPNFEIEQYYLPNDTHDLLVSNPRLGAALASEFSSSSSSSPSSSSSAPSTEPPPPQQRLPDHTLVLMRGHGFTSWARSLKVAVYEGIYALTNARVESEALRVRHAAFRGGFAGAGSSSGGAGSTSDTGSGDSCPYPHAYRGNGVEYLSLREIRETWETMITTIERPWGLWLREVKVNPLSAFATN
ncbi:hypothetical protein VTK56DRAFT_5548 [Thermocarpiscus australiensis]